ncbi:MAG: NAD(P)-dependent alcohol dehydrogenase [Leptospiraceae bacterium]|nr:NAD(P)-dependent alcohol dehydrogenase [Leptospiraceae bacterium]
MIAVLHTKFGSPDELKIIEISKPIPKDNEVLVKMHSTAVTSSDCNIRNLTYVTNVFRPMSRLVFGVFKPRFKRLGMVVAGEIEVTGKKVTKYKKGDRVFGITGMTMGTYAEYVCVQDKEPLVIKPGTMSWEQAAAIPNMASTALYFIRDLGQTRKGQRVLVRGASGGVGSYAVQLARYYGAEVTGVCSASNIEIVKELGADKVIDYTKDDFTKNGETYDIILDATHNSSFSYCKNSLTKTGVYLPVLMGFAELIGAIFNKKIKSGMASDKIEGLNLFVELFKQGKLKPVIGKQFKLEQIADAFKYAESGHKKGNAIVII